MMTSGSEWCNESQRMTKIHAMFHKEWDHMRAIKDSKITEAATGGVL